MAAGFDMNPGKWEFTTTVTMPMLPQPQISTMTECITEEEAKQDPLKDLVDEGSCRVTNKKIEGNTFHFEMNCTQEGGMVTKGKGQFSAKGDNASGSIEMTMDMPQMPNMPAGPMTMNTSWQGKRIGSCD